MLIVNLLHHSECVCTMSTYSNVSIAGAKGENTVSGWTGKCSMGRTAAKSLGYVGEFYIDWRRWSPWS